MYVVDGVVDDEDEFDYFDDGLTYIEAVYDVFFFYVGSKFFYFFK